MKLFSHNLIAAMLCGVLCLVSCVKEDGPEGRRGNSSEARELSAEEEFWSVVGHLIDPADRTDDYQGKTFKPAIGYPENGDESVRIVLTNDPGAAVSRFNQIVGANITEETSSYTYRSKVVGTLTWTKGTDNTCWGTVDVSVPAVPSLQKIIYRSPSQGDENGGVKNGGSAYYRFGDVIRRDHPDGEEEGYEYWICVRPSFDPEGKGDSHWISVSPLPKSNVWPYYKKDQKPYTASNGFHYGLPYNLGSDLEWHQDLAEMIFAIIYPDQWAFNLQNYYKEDWKGSSVGLRMFNDFDAAENIKYHNSSFWKNVQKQWQEKKLFEEIFGVTYNWMEAAVDPDGSGSGLNFLYNGYSWITGNSPKLYEVHYGNSTSEDKEKNMHKETTRVVQSQVVDPKKTLESNINYPFDFYEIMHGDIDDLVEGDQDDQMYVIESRFFGDNQPRWVVRYSTGAKLMESGTYDAQACIKGFEPSKNREVYRYYRDVFPGKELKDGPEITDLTNSSGFSGRAHYRWGNVYKDEKGAKWFVFNQSGYYSEDIEERLNERSPYTELVSFDPVGFNNSYGMGSVSNLPTEDQILRVIPFFYTMITTLTYCVTDEELLHNDASGRTAYNIKEYAGVDIRNLMQYVKSQDPSYRPCFALCVAYKGHNDDGSKQPLLRIVVNGQNPQKESKFYCWTYYPRNPDLTTQFVTNFSNDIIYLQDIADQNMVNKYATDTYAVQPLADLTSPSSSDAKRPVRTQTDQRARDVSNYYYDINTFNNATYPGSMWNEPILFFRYTRIRDCGDSNYDTKTVDGHTLTLVHERDWTVPDRTDDRNEAYDYYKNFPAIVWQTVLDNAVFMNGMPYAVVKWDKLKFDN